MISGHGTGSFEMAGGKFEGEAVFITRSPKLSFLNNKRGRVEATVRGNQTAREIHLRIFAL